MIYLPSPPDSALEMATPPSATTNEFDNVGDDDSSREDTPPDGGYGWICVAACFTINCFTWGTVAVGSPSCPERLELDYDDSFLL